MLNNRDTKPTFIWKQRNTIKRGPCKIEISKKIENSFYQGNTTASKPSFNRTTLDEWGRIFPFRDNGRSGHNQVSEYNASGFVEFLRLKSITCNVCWKFSIIKHKNLTSWMHEMVTESDHRRLGRQSGQTMDHNTGCREIWTWEAEWAWRVAARFLQHQRFGGRPTASSCNTIREECFHGEALLIELPINRLYHNPE